MPENIEPSPGTNPSTNTPPAHQLTSFPVVLVILLHYLTCGIFSTVWFNLMHGKLPTVRSDDPSAGRAVGFCFIPFFNFYWIFFTYRRLCLRVDEQRELYGLAPSNLRGMATAACILQVIPYINLIGLAVFFPIFLGLMQSSVNQLVAKTATTAPRAALPMVQAAPAMPGWAIALVVCGCLVPCVGLLAAIAIPNFVKARSTSQMNACINNLRLIDSAKQQWALEQRKTNTDTPQGSDLQPYLGRGANGELPSCPADSADEWTTSYNINNVGTPPTCRIMPETHVLPHWGR
jgi:hypothetical protein